MNPIGDTKVPFLKRFSKKKNRPEENITTGQIICKCVGVNHAIETCAEACSACWDTKLPSTYEDKAAYVGRRTKTGHTSVLEHSNFIVFLAIDKATYANETLDFLGNCCPYLHTAIDTESDKNNTLLLIGGSYRAYSAMYYHTFDITNPILLAITSELYEDANSNAFLDICALGIMDESMFQNPSLDILDQEGLLISKYGVYDNDKFRIVDYTSPMEYNKIYKNILQVYPEFCSKILLEVVEDLATITVEFKNMTRACTHQLVRHRNGITQESQRYVDYSKANFTSPSKYSDRYSDDYEYTVSFGGVKQHMTLPEIGDNIISIYSNLRSDSAQPLLKEDARAFLPNNTQCGKIYMTFTINHLKKFLKLRCEKHAQEEIRAYATALREYLFPSDLDRAYIDFVDIPNYKLKDTNDTMYNSYITSYFNDLANSIRTTNSTEDTTSNTTVDEDRLIEAYIDKK